MDVVLEVLDTLILDRVYASVLPRPFQQSFAGDALNGTSILQTQGLGAYPIEPASKYLKLWASEHAQLSALPRDNIWRQAISLYLITWLFGIVIYFVFSGLSYLLVFDHTTFNHPKYLKNQVRLEIQQTMWSIPIMAIFTAPCFLAEVRGYAKLYDGLEEAPFPLYNLLQFPLFILFTDFFIYWIHRGLHHPRIYKTLHKPHHKWIMPTPFASHAFHPIDGFSQSVPYHVFPFIFPLQKFAYVALFLFINVWTIMIHDGEYVANSPIINGAACHTMHHLYFNYNYGQFTTLWDRIGGSYRKPNEELFSKESKTSKTEWEKQTQEMERLQQAVEGADDREYGQESHRNKKLD